MAAMPSGWKLAHPAEEDGAAFVRRDDSRAPCPAPKNAPKVQPKSWNSKAPAGTPATLT
jgi:hypothetical protein